MKYYKARITTQLPLIQFDLVAESDAQLSLSNQTLGGLIVSETQLTDDQDPNYISFPFGICSKKVSGNSLIDRPQGEIDAQEIVLKEAEAARSGSDFEIKLGESFLIYDGKKFPLTSGSRERYRAIISKGTGDHTLLTSTDDYLLLAANIPAFKTALDDVILNASYSNL